MQENKISIIMPSYNSERYIAEAIDSVIAQSYADWELIVIDDGSEDESGKILDYYAEENDRIKVFHTENKGVSTARNLGLSAATGKWIAFIDSDDIFPQNALEFFINSSSDCDVVIGNHTLFPKGKQLCRLTRNETYRNPDELESDFAEYFNSGFFSTVWGKLIKREIINVGFREDVTSGEDTLFLSCIIGNIKRIAFITDTVYLYRTDNDDSLSQSFNTSLLNVLEITINNYSRFFHNDEITSKIKLYFLRGVINTVKLLFKCTGMTDDERRKVITSLLKNDMLKNMSRGRFPLTPKGQRRATVLIIGDVDLIMREFGEAEKQSKT